MKCNKCGDMITVTQRICCDNCAYDDDKLHSLFGDIQTRIEWLKTFDDTANKIAELEWVKNKVEEIKKEKI